jgi:hypothetical protein
MNDFMKNILQAVIIAFIPLFARYIGALIEVYGAKHHMEEISKVVSEAVRITSQVYVDELKKDGVFNDDAQKIALEQAVQTAIDLFTPATEKYIEKLYGDVDAYLENKIEAEVKRQKQLELNDKAQ